MVLSPDVLLDCNKMATSAVPKKVAVVGSGVAGLSAAFLLSREHSVHLFEREAAVGMDAHSLDAKGSRVDIPLRVFSESYYPNLINLYKLIGVKYRLADYSFSIVGGARATTSAYLRYINLFVGGMALPLPMCLNPQHIATNLWLMYQFIHFVNYSPGYLAAGCADADLPLADFLSKHGYPAAFATDMLYPMLSVVCTCSYAAVAEYPARIVVDYFAAKYGLSGAQCRAYEGTRDVVARLTAPVARVVTSANIERVDAAPSSVSGGSQYRRSSSPGRGGEVAPELVHRAADGACELRWTDGFGVTHVERFDEVVLAMQANASARVLQKAHPKLMGALRTFRYERKRVVLHTDDSLMPAQRRDWSPLNLVVSPSEDAASVTVWMNHIDSDLRSELRCDVFQTWNPTVEPSKGSVLADFSFERPVVTASSVRAMQALAECQGGQHVWLVGAYALNSMPLLENGVKSAIAVAKSLGCDVSDVEFDEAQWEAKQQASRALRRSLLLLVIVLVLTLLHAAWWG